jgi:plasmid maintenance system antidote protein VapI
MPSVIIVLPSSSALSSSTIATLYLEGVAGFVSDPYTSEDLSELVTKIMEQRTKKISIEENVKTRKASNFLLADAMSLIDEVARLRYEGKEGGYALRDLKALSSNFANYYAQDPEKYMDAMVELFQKAKAPAWAKGTARKQAKVKISKHPGVVVWELMAERGIAEDRLPALLRVDAPTAAALVRGQVPVDKPMAESLSRIFGMSPREWLKMQVEFDADKIASGREKKEG